MNCPECSSDQARRLKVIYEMGTSDSSAETVIFGGDDIDVAVTAGISQSRMAQKCSPPNKKGVFFWIVVLTLSAVFDIGLFANAFALGVVGVAGTVISLLIIAKALNFNKTKWPRLYDLWLRCWICLKCGKVFKSN